MAHKKNQKQRHQLEQQSSEQTTAPATPLELSDEELEQVVGGKEFEGTSASTGPGGLPILLLN